MSNRRTAIKFPVFGYTVRVILARNIGRTGQRLGMNDLHDAKAAFVTDDPAPPYGWLILPLKPTPDLIAHEAAHAVRAILDRAGVGPDDETFAYHLDYLVGRVHKFVEGRRHTCSTKHKSAR